MEAVAHNGGLKLLGIDVPEKVTEGKLRIFAAVEKCSEQAPTHIALIVRNQSPEGNVRVARILKAVPADGTSVAVGMEVPFEDDGSHVLQVSICAADATGTVTDSLFQSEYDNVLCAVHTHRPPMPRLDQKDALVLCGVDVPTHVASGKMQVFVALKRVWDDAPRDVALIVRNKLPNGDRRAAVVYRTLGDDAEAIGIDVPMGEAGTHELTLQIAKVVNGENIEIFRIDGRKVEVTNPPPVILAENADLRLCGIDIPKQVDAGSMRVIVSVQRTSVTAPMHLALIARNTLPDGSTRASVVKKLVHQFDTDTIGMEVPLGEAGDHWLQFSVAECTSEGLVEIFHIPARMVTVTNPPMPRLAEQGAVVLCGVDVQGGRWPNLNANEVVDGRLRVIMALARTWDDAPKNFALLVRDLNSGRVAVVRKSLGDLVPATIGLDVPMMEEGQHLIQVTVAAVEVSGEFTPLFHLPPTRVEVRPVKTTLVLEAPEKELLPQEVPKVVDEVLTDLVAPVKVTLSTKGVDSVIRRMSVSLKLNSTGLPVGGFSTVLSSVSSSFRSDLLSDAKLRLTYRDEDGDSVVISSDHELQIALQHCDSSNLLRLKLLQ